MSRLDYHSAGGLCWRSYDRRTGPLSQVRTGQSAGRQDQPSSPFSFQGTCMVHANESRHGLLTPGLAFAMSCVGSFLGLRCAGRARACAGLARGGWLLLAASAIGATGIWVMHNIALLGFSVPGQVIRYDVNDEPAVRGGGGGGGVRRAGDRRVWRRGVPAPAARRGHHRRGRAVQYGFCRDRPCGCRTPSSTTGGASCCRS